MSKKTSSKKTVKKVSSKKSAVKKTASKKAVSAKKTSPEKSVLSVELKSAIKELDKLLPELDEKGIQFLIQQAGVLIHNKNAAAPEERKERENRFNERMEEWSEKQHSLLEHVAVEEGSRGNHFILVMGNYRNFFVMDEMKKVVKLCHAADDDIDAGRRLYNWLEKNRSDVLKNSSISSSSDQSLKKLYDVIVSTYTTKS